MLWCDAFFFSILSNKRSIDWIVHHKYNTRHISIFIYISYKYTAHTYTCWLFTGCARNKQRQYRNMEYIARKRSDLWAEAVNWIFMYSNKAQSDFFFILIYAQCFEFKMCYGYAPARPHQLARYMIVCIGIE